MSKIDKVKTSLYIEHELLKDLKLIALNTNVKVNDIIIDCIKFTLTKKGLKRED